MPTDPLPLPDKKEGDTLGAGHVNALTEAAEMVLAHFQGSHTFGHDRNPATIPPFVQRVVIVVATSCDGDANVYNVRERYWDNTDNSWKTNDRGEGWCLDASDFSGVSLSVNDKIVAYYDPQRGAFIPCAGPCFE